MKEKICPICKETILINNVCAKCTKELCSPLKPIQTMKEQAEKHIIDNYGKNWWEDDWNTNDVIDIMIAFAEEKAWKAWKVAMSCVINPGDWKVNKKQERKKFEDWWKQKEKESC